MFKDTVLNTVPAAIVAVAMEESFKAGRVCAPGSQGTALRCDLKGPLYVLGEDIITADELSWALRRGYVRSQFVGRTVIVGGAEHSYEEFVKPRVEYHVTQKGRDTRRWT